MNSGHSFHLNTHTPQATACSGNYRELINAALRSVDPSQAVKNFLRFDGQTLTIGGKDFVRTDFTDISFNRNW